jgi:hypothetical protein
MLHDTSTLGTLTVFIMLACALRTFAILRMFNFFHALRTFAGFVMLACALRTFAVLAMFDFLANTFCAFTICIMLACALRTFAVLTMFQYAHHFSTRTLIAFFFRI